MISERDDLSRFRDAYLDYLEGVSGEPPVLEDLPEEQRLPAESFIKSIRAARGGPLCLQAFYRATAGLAFAQHRPIR